MNETMNETSMNETFRDLEHFYSANPARRSSPEADYGVHWRLAGWPGSWRVSYVRDTGEVYALGLGPGSGPLLLLGAFPIDPDAGPGDVYYHGFDRLLKGWPDHCGPTNGLAWLIRKIVQAGPAGAHTHLFGRRDAQGGETALCGAQDGKVLFLYQLDGTTGRFVSCQICVELSNKPGATT